MQQRRRFPPGPCVQTQPLLSSVGKGLLARVLNRHPCRGHTCQSSRVLPTDGNWKSQCNRENLQRMQRCIGVVLWFQDNNVKLTKVVCRLLSWRRVMYMHAVVLSNRNKSYKLQLCVIQHVHVSNVDYTVNR